MPPAHDPLALPAVPPPAPDGHRSRDWLFALAFVFALADPAVRIFHNASRTTTEFENRAAAPWPDRTAGSTFQARFEQAFADRFGRRDELIELHHRALIDVFNVSPVPKVLLGRDGWLFFMGEDGHSIDRHYRGVVPFSDAEVAGFVREITRRSAYLRAHGIPYVATVVPDKATIYPELLPAWIHPSRRPSPLVRATEELASQGQVDYVDLRPVLLQAKRSQRVYFITDSHWNLVGANLGYDVLMHRIQRALPQGRLPVMDPAPGPPYVPRIEDYSGDLSNMLALRNRFVEPDLAPLSNLLADKSRRCARRIDNEQDPLVEIYECNRPELPRAVMFRDSNAIPIIPLLSENFSRIVYVGSRAMDLKLIARERPDVVIEEMAERSLNAPAFFPLQEP